MSVAETLLREVFEKPDDLRARLVYADLLDEVGDPRAELIRLQCQPDRGAARRRPSRREQELLQKHGRQWAGELSELAISWSYQHGFIEHVEISGESFAEHATRLQAAHPIRSVCLHPPLQLDRWLDTPGLERLRGLELRDETIDETLARRLASATGLRQLQRLVLQRCDLEDRALSHVLASSLVEHLELLDLNDNLIGDSGATAISLTLPLGGLQFLRLQRNKIGVAGASALAASHFLRHLKMLDLQDNPLLDASPRNGWEARLRARGCRVWL